MVHSCTDLEQYVQFLELVEEARAADHETPLKWASRRLYAATSCVTILNGREVRF